MTDLSNSSLLEDCNSCLQKNHESWKLYFSKWEALAENEVISDEDMINEIDEDIVITKDKNKERRRQDESSSDCKLSEKSILRNIKSGKKKKGKMINRRKIPKKKKKMIQGEKSDVISNENLREDMENNMDYDQLEKSLKSVFMSILKTNKNKWEIFSILSHTNSNEETEAVYSQSLLYDQCPILESCHGEPLHSGSLSCGNRSSSSSNFAEFPDYDEDLINGLKNSVPGSFNFRSYQHSTYLDRKGIMSGQGNDIVSSNFSTNGLKLFNKSCLNALQSHLASFRIPTYLPQTLIQKKKIEFRIQGSFIRSCPRKTVFQSNLSDNVRHINEPSNSLALHFHDEYLRSNTSKGNNECLESSMTDSVALEQKISKEKTIENLCLYKMTNNFSRNMENSNFITPKRKLTERKCFSGNVVQGKNRRLSKLSFLDYDEDSSDSDSETESRSPIIQWKCKKRKIEETPIVTLEKSESVGCESIFDRVIKPIS